MCGVAFRDQCQEAFEAAQRGGQPIEALVQHAGFAPQTGVVRRDAQHVLGAGQRARQIAGLQPAAS